MSGIFKNLSINIYLIHYILGYLFILFNACIMFILIIKIKNREKNIKRHKIKLCMLIIFDSISTLLYIYKHFLFKLNFIFVILSLCVFYLFISIIYDIFNSTEIHVLAKRPKMRSKLAITIFLFLINLSYYKLTKNKIFNIVVFIFIICGLILIYIYFFKLSKNISNNLIAGDFQGKKIYNFFNMINIYCLSMLIASNITKIFLIFLSKKDIIYAELAISIFNYSIKYYVFSLLLLIIINLNKKSYKQYNEEIITIMNTGVYTN